MISTTPIVYGEAACVELRQRRAYGVFFCPAVHMGEHVIQFRQRHANLAHIAFGSGFIQIPEEGCVDFIFSCKQSIAQTAQRSFAEGDVQRFALEKIRALSCDDVFNGHGCSSCTSTDAIWLFMSAWQRGKGNQLYSVRICGHTGGYVLRGTAENLPGYRNHKPFFNPADGITENPEG